MQPPYRPGASDGRPVDDAALRPIPAEGLPGRAGLILSVLLALAAAALGVSVCGLLPGFPSLGPLTPVAVVIPVAALLILYLWRSTRRVRALIPLLLLAGFFIMATTGSLLPAVATLCLLFAVGEGALLLATLPREKRALVPFIPIAAYLLTLLVCRDPLGAAVSLVPFPPALALALATRRSAEREDGPTRVGVICLTSLTLGLSALAAAALLVLGHKGTLTLAAVASLLEQARAALAATLSSRITPEMAETITPEVVEALVNSLFNLSPALVVVVSNILSAIAQMVLHAALHAFGLGDSVTARVKAFRMSMVSCVVFLLGYLVALIAGGTEVTPVSTVAENIYFILLPGLAMAGLIRIVTMFARKGPQGGGCIFFFLILVPFLLLFAPPLLAFVEAIGQPLTALFARLKPKDNGSDDNDPFGGNRRPPSDSDSDSDSHSGGNGLF